MICMWQFSISFEFFPRPRVVHSISITNNFSSLQYTYLGIYPQIHAAIILIKKKPVNHSFPIFSESFRRFNVTVLSDEIYGLLHFKGQHQSLAKWYPEGTLVTTGFSKWASAGGWRMGYIIIPPEMKAVMTILQSAASQTYSCAPAPMQHAITKV